MKIILTEQQITTLTESLYKDNDIYDYEPTQSEIDAFIKDKNQWKDYDKISDQYPRQTKKPKIDDVKPKLKKNGYAFLYYLSQQVGYGPIRLMRWKKNEIFEKELKEINFKLNLIMVI